MAFWTLEVEITICGSVAFASNFLFQLSAFLGGVGFGFGDELFVQHVGYFGFV